MLKKPAPNQADNIAIFQSCLLPKMRLSVDLEGRCTAYKSPLTTFLYLCVITFSSIFDPKNGDVICGCLTFVFTKNNNSGLSMVWINRKKSTNLVSITYIRNAFKNFLLYLMLLKMAL